MDLIKDKKIFIIIIVVLIIVCLFYKNYYEGFNSEETLDYIAACLPTYGFGGKDGQAVYSEAQCASLGGIRFIKDPSLGVCTINNIAQTMPNAQGHAMEKCNCDKLKGVFTQYSCSVGYCQPYSGYGKHNLCSNDDISYDFGS